MKVWWRSAALAVGVLLVVTMHTGAQIREGGGSASSAGKKAGLVERRGHPEVLLNTRDPEFVGGERVVVQIMLKRLDPKEAYGKISVPPGIDGVIAYPGARMLMIRGTKEAVAGYRASLEKLDRDTAGDGLPAAATVEARPEITLAAKGKLALKADRVTQDGAVTRATGGVVIELANGVELRAQQVRVVTEGGQRRIVIEK